MSILMKQYGTTNQNQSSHIKKDLNLSSSLADFRNEIRNSVADKISLFGKGQFDTKKVESRILYQSPDKLNYIPSARPQQSQKTFSELSEKKLAQLSSQCTLQQKFKTNAEETERRSTNNSPQKLSVQRGIERIGKKNYDQNYMQQSQQLSSQSQKSKFFYPTNQVLSLKSYSPNKKSSPIKKSGYQSVTKNQLRAEIQTIYPKKNLEDLKRSNEEYSKRNSEPFQITSIFDSKRSFKPQSPTFSEQPKLFFEDIYNPSKKLMTVQSPSSYTFYKLIGIKKLSDKVSQSQIQDIRKQIEQTGVSDANLLSPQYMEELTKLASAITSLLKKTSYYQDKKY